MVTADRPLRGKVALVTGASRGLGKGCAVELGAAGSTVYLTARTFDEPGAIAGTAAETAREVTDAGGSGIPVRCDHADDEEVQAVVDRIVEDEGRLDILVNGVYPTPGLMPITGPEMPGGAPFWQTPVDGWETTFTVAVRGHYLMTQKAMPLLLGNGGLIVNIASAGASVYFHSVLYGAGKSANDRMMRDMAFELRDTTVACLSVWPGWVVTELTDQMFADGHALLRDYQKLAWADFPDRDEVLARLSDEDLKDLLETPRFTGRAVAALATDSAVKAKSGRALSVVGLADEYGFTDVDGRRPDAFRFREKEYWPALG